MNLFVKVHKVFSIQEFIIATDMTTGGSVEEQLRWAFKMYDQDGSGIYHKIFKFNFVFELKEELITKKW